MCKIPIKTKEKKKASIIGKTWINRTRPWSNTEGLKSIEVIFLTLIYTFTASPLKFQLISYSKIYVER